jgi:hypothetical protein
LTSLLLLGPFLLCCRRETDLTNAAEQKAKEDDDRHRRAAVNRAMQRLSAVESAERDPLVAIDHFLETDGLGT